MLGCFPAVEIRRPARSRVSQHQAAEYWEANGPLRCINQTHAHTRTERESEIKKISVRDWLPCCLVKLNCWEVKKKNPNIHLCTYQPPPAVRATNNECPPLRDTFMVYFIRRIWVEDLTSEHYPKWSGRSFFFFFFARVFAFHNLRKLIGRSNLYLPQCALDGDRHTEIKMRFCKWIFLLSLYLFKFFFFFVRSSCVFNPRGQSL